MLKRLFAAALLSCPVLAQASLFLTTGPDGRDSSLILNLCCSSSTTLDAPTDSRTLVETSTDPTYGLPTSATATGSATDTQLRLTLDAHRGPQVSSQAVFYYQVTEPSVARVLGSETFQDGATAPFLQIEALAAGETGNLLYYSADNRGDATPSDGLALGDVSPNATVFRYDGATSFSLLPGRTYSFSAALLANDLDYAPNGVAKSMHGYVSLTVTPVPEPTAIVLAVAGLAVLGLAAKRTDATRPIVGGQSGDSAPTAR